MGVHTGEAVVRDGDYIGLDVHRAARICSAGHGGQVVVSSSTRELIADELPEDVALGDLGEHRLKDLDRPEHLFQVIAGDLPHDFPPLGSMSPAARGGIGLPAAPNRTIGREADVRAIINRLNDGSVRLLTLTGPGGVGKTRLALEAAWTLRDEFADGARFVGLAAVRRAQDVPSAIVQALGVVPISGETPEQSVQRFLSAKRMLLVLDNVEHLLSAAGFVAELRSACPGVTVLATSREPLALAGEQRYPVAPLALPLKEDQADAVAQVPAVALFAERARAQDPAFAVAVPTRRRSRRSAAASMGCRWRSSSRPPAAACSPPKRSPNASTPRSRCSAAGRATRRHVSRHCGRRCTGAISYSATTRRRASDASRSSSAARLWRRSRRSPERASTRSTGSSPRP
jgi:hypothetical protein